MIRLFRRLRGAIKNGLVWAGAWALANVGISALFRVMGLRQNIPFLQAVPSLLIGGAAVGFVAGATFSVGLAAIFRNRELEEISTLSFSLVGAAAAAVLVPGLLFLPLLWSGAAVSAAELLINGGLAGMLGGTTAFGMIKLAKAVPELPPRKEPVPVGSGDRALTESD